jgi:lysophospholipase L1-like esterase
MIVLSRRLLLQAVVAVGFASPALAADAWVATWVASAHGPYPSGNPSGQVVQDFAFPDAAQGARDQTIRMMVRPDLWGRTIRLRFSNAFGTRPLALDGVFVGLQASGGNVAPRTNQPVTFARARSVTIAPGATAWSDPVTLPFVRNGDPMLAGRRLAVSVHLPGPTGPMTWHAKSLTTSYVTAPGGGARGGDESDTAFPYTSASWFFLDMVDVMAPAGTAVVVAFGDSITDGTGTTINGDDRWVDVLSRRLHARYGERVSVVNAGIGGNQVVGPREYTIDRPYAGGPSALERLERDVLQISGVRTVIWFEGINDLGTGDAIASEVIAGYQQGLQRLRARNIRVVGATVLTALGAQSAHGSPEVDSRRDTLNAWIRTPGNFDAVIDFDAVTRDPATGSLRAPFQPSSTIGGPGDKLHPNRAGYLAMGESIDLAALGLDGPPRQPPRRVAQQR